MIEICPFRGGSCLRGDLLVFSAAYYTSFFRPVGSEFRLGMSRKSPRERTILNMIKEEIYVQNFG